MTNCDKSKSNCTKLSEFAVVGTFLHCKSKKKREWIETKALFFQTSRNNCEIFLQHRKLTLIETVLSLE